jgi:hypothetical protein
VSAAARLTSLASGRRDPLSFAEVADCRPRDHRVVECAPSAKMVDAGVTAAGHLLDAGLTPIVALPTLRALWRRGDRALAMQLAKLRGAA